MHYLQIRKGDVKVLVHIGKPHQTNICDNECAKVALLNKTIAMRKTCVHMTQEVLLSVCL
jgi:hypothetical protein